MRLPLLLLLVPLAQEPADFTGAWSGTIETVDLEVHVDLAHEEGDWSGDISIPAQGAKDLPLRDFVLEDGALTFVIDGVPGEPTFVARTEDGDVLAGEFTQFTLRAPFRLERERSRVPETLADLEGLDAWIEEELEAWKVPGLALAVVREGEVARVTGHGLRDREEELPVTPDTLFAIGSSSKAFTTTALATLAAEGAFEWEDPLIELLPGFRLHDEYATHHLTPLDMATHRSGLPRHDLTWYGRQDFGGEAVFESLRHLGPNAELREEWQYNNLMYVTLGYLASRLDGRPWEELVRARLLDPLGMPRTNFSVRDSQADPDHALPYDEDDDELVRIPFRDISHVGPAGSINSSAREMARWALLQLSDGEVEGTEVLPGSALTALHAPRIVVADTPAEPELGPLLYAQGWMVDAYRGHRRVHHGGNIDGFSALVACFPDDGLGVVVLTNRNGTPLPEFVVRRVADLVLGHEPRDWSAKGQARRTAITETMEQGEAKAEERRVQGTSPSHDLDAFTGTFRHPAYGGLTVAREGEGLECDLHGLPLALEHWHYDVFSVTEVEGEESSPLEDTKLRFETDLAGDVTAVIAPLEPAVAPLRFERAPDPELSDPEYLARFAGDYSLMGQRLEVTVRGNALTVHVPGQEPTRLVPRWNDSFRLEEQEGVTLSFEVVDGVATSIVLEQAGRTFVAQRRADDSES